MWIHRANYNAHQLGAAGMRFTPGWAVGWFFIPIANLWKPYQVMKEIWKASANPAHWQDQRRGSILPWWWALFLASGFVSNASGRAALLAETIPALTMVNIVDIVGNALEIASASIALALVIQIFQMQVAKRPSSAPVAVSVEA
jgi:hypothetical protein